MTPRRPRLIVCDDDPDLREMVQEYFQARGYDVAGADGAPAMREALAEAPTDAIILDITMPGEDGLTALRALRAVDATPVVILTAIDDVVDRVLGLELGADDYVGKPVELRELEARVRAVRRRREPLEPPTAPATPSESTNRIRFGRCALDLDSARLFGPDGSTIAITATEFSLLALFARNRGRVLARSVILDQVNDGDAEPFDRSIDSRVARLRRKIGDNTRNPQVIRTVRSVGYIYG
ncbi:MAG: response regulator transcription factor [Devosia sp.]